MQRRARLKSLRVGQTNRQGIDLEAKEEAQENNSEAAELHLGRVWHSDSRKFESRARYPYIGQWLIE